MSAPRRTLPVVAVLALLAAAAPALAAPLDGDVSASASVDGDGSAQVTVEDRGLDVDAQRAMETGTDALDSATVSAGTSTFSSSGSGGPKVDGSGGVLRGEPVSTSQAASAVGLLALAAYGLAKLEAAAWVRRGAGLALVPLYSRMDRSEILDHETRQEMYDLIREEAGISMQEVADEVGCGWGTVVYHLEKLEDGDFVVSERTGGRRRFFAAGDVEPDEKDAVGVLRQETPKRIVAQLLRDPGTNQSELCEALDIAASTASKHLGRLEEAGLVERERDWRQVHYYPADDLRERVPSAPDTGDGGDAGVAAAPV
jgi:DNA-binding MarR family transcriptional regulator